MYHGGLPRRGEFETNGLADTSRGRILGWKEAGAGGKEPAMACQMHMHTEQMDASGPGEKGGLEGKEIGNKRERVALNPNWEDWICKAVKITVRVPLRSEVFGTKKHEESS